MATTSQCIACESNLEQARRNSSACQGQLKLANKQRDMTAVELLKIQNMYDEISELVHLELQVHFLSFFLFFFLFLFPFSFFLFF